MVLTEDEVGCVCTDVVDFGSGIWLKSQAFAVSLKTRLFFDLLKII
jgi:hypothetical protein